MQILFLMAGEGQRFKEKNQSIIKPLIDVFGKPMAVRAMETLGVHGNYIVVIQNNECGRMIEKAISSYYPSTKFVFVEKLTEGPACSALAAEKYIDNAHPLIITNCDQILTWDKNAFNLFVKQTDYDGIIVTYHCQSPKNSYALTDTNGLVTKIKEKEVLSDISLNGVHYWKCGEYFVSSAKKMIANKDKNAGEYYVGPTYNYMIKEGKKVGIYHIPVSHHHAIGTPEDLERYIKHAGS